VRRQIARLSLVKADQTEPGAEADARLSLVEANCTEYDEDGVSGVSGGGGAGGESGSESNGEDHCHDGETQELAEDASWSE